MVFPQALLPTLVFPVIPSLLMRGLLQSGKGIGPTLNRVFLDEVLSVGGEVPNLVEERFCLSREKPLPGKELERVFAIVHSSARNLRIKPARLFGDGDRRATHIALISEPVPGASVIDPIRDWR